MKMRSVKLLSILLVLVMTAALGVGAFAEETLSAPEGSEAAGPEETQDAISPDSGESAPAPAAADRPAAGDSSPPAGEPEEEYGYLILNAGNYGYFEYPWQTEIQIEVVKGSRFTADDPTAISDAFLFEGWYTGIQGSGERITGETVIGEELKAYGCWRPNPTAIPVMELNAVYPLDITSMGEIFAFTPSETASYDIYTAENDPFEGTAVIHLMDDQLNHIAYSKKLDNDLNAIISMELTADTTYYILFSEGVGLDTFFNASIRLTETVPVTFHVPESLWGEAYFDGDPSVVEKTVDVRKGSHVETYQYSGLEFADPRLTVLLGWTLEPDAPFDDEEEIVVTEPIDVYAVAHFYKEVVLDANGGKYPEWAQDETRYFYRYTPGDVFTPPYDPSIDDSDLAFAGWATTADAAEPDIFESLEYEDLGEVVYAVYTGKVTVTFDANGGYLNGNPDLETCQRTYGKGHIFYTMHAEYDDPNMEIMGWMDQHGVIVPYSRLSVAGYQYMEDTCMTALWGRYIVADANGGCFRFNAELTAVDLLFPAYKPFSNDRVIELVGEPIHFDDTKYLAGWATDPDAEEPDVIEGETDVMGLRKIFAVWKDDSYYIAEGEDQTWEKGGVDGLRVVVKRTGDDTVTFSCFRGAAVDEEQPDFRIDEGSLILTLPASYLETLDAGEHVLQMRFTQDVTLETTFTVKEPEKPSDQDKDKDKDKDRDPDKSDSDKNKSSDTKKDSAKNSAGMPDTGDRTDVLPWAVLLGLSLAGIAGTASLLAVRRKKDAAFAEAAAASRRRSAGEVNRR